MTQDDDLSPEDEARRQHLIRLLTLGGLSMAPITQFAGILGKHPRQVT